MVIDDPLAIYFNDVAGPDAIPIRVAKDSHSLRSIMMLIDNKEEIECVLDPGSMIIAISEACCNNLGLLYDPTFRLHMESANGEVDESLGLARNVPFSIGPVTLFLQLHVVRSPAYDILLGRPFDVLTQSVIKNYQNEDMTLTIEDPNAHKVCTIPTLRRGPPRYSMKPTDKQQDFR
jgi:Aspartyl protease